MKTKNRTKAELEAIIEKLSKQTGIDPTPKPWAPTKWRPEMNESLVAHFSGCRTKTVVRMRRDKQGNESESEVEQSLSCPTLQKWCADNDIDPDTLNEWVKPEHKDDYPGFSGAYRKAKALQHDWVNEGAMSGNFNPAWSIFFAKNNMGMRDRFENETTYQNPDGSPLFSKATFTITPDDDTAV